MKFFACVLLVGVLVAVAMAIPVQESSINAEDQLQALASDAELEDEVRVRKSAAAYNPSPKSYGGSSGHHEAVYPGPSHTYSYGSPAPQVPCGKHLLFSCQPSVAPVPCVAPKYSAPSYSAAYSEPVPTYAYPAYY